MEEALRAFGAALSTKQHGGEPIPLSLVFDSLGRELRVGEELHPSQATHQPRVTWPDDGQSYTLLLLDPDAPRPEDANQAPWLHWLVTNASTGTVSKGSTVTAWAPPTPPHGLHRYIALLCRQSGPGGVSVEPPQARSKFPLASLLRDNHLSVAGATYFTVRPEGPRHHAGGH